VRRYLGAGRRSQAGCRTAGPLRPLTASPTRSMVGRAQRVVERGTVWRPDVGSLAPDRVARFSSVIAERFPLPAGRYQVQPRESGGEAPSELTLSRARAIPPAPGRPERRAPTPAPIHVEDASPDQLSAVPRQGGRRSLSRWAAEPEPSSPPPSRRVQRFARVVEGTAREQTPTDSETPVDQELSPGRETATVERASIDGKGEHTPPVVLATVEEAPGVTAPASVRLAAERTRSEAPRVYSRLAAPAGAEEGESDADRPDQRLPETAAEPDGLASASPQPGSSTHARAPVAA
jgi:hypothetical protein